MCRFLGRQGRRPMRAAGRAETVSARWPRILVKNFTVFEVGAVVLGLVCGVLIGPKRADAQLVRFGPRGGVSVWAPFVHVEVAPGGSTYVRAPFTSVVTPGRRRIGPRYDDRYARPSLPYPGYPARRRSAGRFEPGTSSGRHATNSPGCSRRTGAKNAADRRR